MSASSTCTNIRSPGPQPLAAAMARTHLQARAASSANVPGANFPSAPSAGIPLMYTMPLAALARLNGNPAGRPWPPLIRLIVMVCPSAVVAGRHRGLLGPERPFLERLAEPVRGEPHDPQVPVLLLARVAVPDLDPGHRGRPVHRQDLAGHQEGLVRAVALGAPHDLDRGQTGDPVLVRARPVGRVPGEQIPQCLGARRAPG